MATRRSKPVTKLPRAAVFLARAVQLPEKRQAAEQVVRDCPGLTNAAWTSYRWVQDQEACVIELIDSNAKGTQRLNPEKDKDKVPPLIRPFVLMDRFVYQDQFLSGGLERWICPAQAEISYRSTTFVASDALITVFRLSDLPITIFGVSLGLARVSVLDTIFARRALYRDDVRMAISVGNGQPALSFRRLCSEISDSYAKRSRKRQRLGDVECTFAVTELLMPRPYPENLDDNERYGLLRCDESFSVAPSDKVSSRLTECKLPDEAGWTWYADDLHLLVLNSKEAGPDVNPIPVNQLSISSRNDAIPVFAHSFAEIIACYKGAHELISAYSVDLVASTKGHTVKKLSKMQKEIANIKRKIQPLMMRETDLVSKALRREQIQAIVDRAESILKDSKEAVELEARVRSLSMSNLLSSLFLFGALIGVLNFLIPKQGLTERISITVFAVVASVVMYLVLRNRSG
jgi:hypothetical protein